MKDIIELKSRGGERNYLKRLNKPDNSESKTYLLKVDNPYFRTGEVSGKKFINLSGGSTITEGSTLKEAEAVVKSIDFATGYGYTITFE